MMKKTTWKNANKEITYYHFGKPQLPAGYKEKEIRLISSRPLKLNSLFKCLKHTVVVKENTTAIIFY